MRVPDDPERIAIERVRPDVDCGRFAVKRVVGDMVRVEADVFTDGHDELAVVLEYQRCGARSWSAVSMDALGNDRWSGSFPVPEVGGYRFRIVAWVDELATWHHCLEKKLEAGQAVDLDFEEGALLAEQASKRANARDRDSLTVWAQRLRGPVDARTVNALGRLVGIGRRCRDAARTTTFDNTSPIWVDRELARCSAWYEMFPRSASSDPGRPGTFVDVAARLPYVAEMGFDVLYLPPIHPIGTTHRKGRNNTSVATADDVGSPWAIGNEEGGHTAVHADLGTIDDFEWLVGVAREHGIELALDLAFQMSPDHPWVTEHPQWFNHRPDGTIAYAENPPKRYQDIFPLDFDCDDWPALWNALLDVVSFWIEQGVRVFRVDNPHTKPYAFWEWLIASVRRSHPDVIFLAEAFTRPAPMRRLAKAGFTQSYTYFTWRNGKDELVDYVTELTQPEHMDFFRPNLWPNTPDILHANLQHGTRGTFIARFVLASCLGANYGIYGPAFELQERLAREEGSEEYLDSEKYQVRLWDIDRPDSLRHFIAHVNAIRRSHPALQRDDTLRFHSVDNPTLICWSKQSPAGDDTVVVVVNLDPVHTQSGWVALDRYALGLETDVPLAVRDLLTGAKYEWSGHHNFVQLDPGSVPAHVFEIRAAR